MGQSLPKTRQHAPNVVQPFYMRKECNDVEVPIENLRKRFRVSGRVQGVGFRPFVHSLAIRLKLSGFVLNDSSGVLIEVEGPPSSLEAFTAALTNEAPPISSISKVVVEEIGSVGSEGFAIAPSISSGKSRTPISPDIATCDDCLAELRDPSDRRFGYPFVNCTNCGPRFTITESVPYDRPNTTMSGFLMCARCRAEYLSPSDRRFHAQPIACRECGPTLFLKDGHGTAIEGDPLQVSAQMLCAGNLLAVKGLGGYHLVCDATLETAVADLRRRKGREEKPLAVMVADMEAAEHLAVMTDDERELLSSQGRPIVLVKKRFDIELAPSVSPGNSSLGLMLPYTPLHHLLLDAVGSPLVMTSGNVSEEPIQYQDEEAVKRLGPMVDGLLSHDRPIRMRCDDSVVRIVAGHPYPIRRSRGLVPEPLRLQTPFQVPVLGVGGHLKNAFCLAAEDQAVLSHHIGDLQNYESLVAFEDAIGHFRRVFDIDPEVVAHDLHEDYLSTRWARRQDGLRTLAVQHHHAHIASCLVDNGRSDLVIGLALDGSGMGDDGTLWGCEVLVCDLNSYERRGHLREIPLPGGPAAVREPWRMAVSYLSEAFGEDAYDIDVGFVRRTAEKWAPLIEMARKGLNSPTVSSAGRLFDAVAAVCGLQDHSTYEGQAAASLEQVADPASTRSYGASLDGPIIDGVHIFRRVVEDLTAGRAVPEVAAAFHNSLAETLVAASESIRCHTGLAVVALSGGSWQNLLLLEKTMAGLQRAGFETLIHRRVPTNDAGLSLGQAAIAHESSRNSDS